MAVIKNSENKTTPKNSENKTAPKVTFEGGTIRDSTLPRYDLITPELVRRLALTLTEGAKKYGERNWVKSATNKQFAIDSLNHAIAHLFDYANGDDSEDHLGHAVCNIMFVMQYDKLSRQELFYDHF